MLPASAVGLAALLTLAAVRLARVGPRPGTDSGDRTTGGAGRRDRGALLHAALGAHGAALVALDALAAGGGGEAARMAPWAQLPTAALVVAAVLAYRGAPAEAPASERAPRRATLPGTADDASRGGPVTTLAVGFGATTVAVSALASPGDLVSALPLVWLVAIAAVDVAASARQAGSRPRDAGRPAGEAVTLPAGSAARSELLRAEQLGSLGLASGALAHEVGSPLGVALSSLSLARDELDQARSAAGVRAGPGSTTDDAARRAAPESTAAAVAIGRLRAADAAIDDAQQSLRRVRGLLETLASLTVEVDAPAAPQRVDEAIDAALALTRALLMPRARVTVRGERGLMALAQPGAVPQVLVNLLVHAAHAVPADRAVPSRVDVTTALDGASVSIEVRDDGDGMTTDALRALFQLDATPSGGAAVALAIARRVVERHGGHMEVESVLGQGTARRVFFSAASEAAATRGRTTGTQVAEGVRGADATPDAARPEPCGRRPRVLLVDDEALLARVTARLLSRDFDVVAVPSIDAALASVRDGRLPDVVLCDLLLPGSSGKEVYLRLCRAHPVLADRFTFVTGGATDPVLAAFPAQVGRPVMRKPVEPNELAAYVREQAARAASAPPSS